MTESGLQISTEQWMDILRDPQTTKPNMLEILKAFHARPHHAASLVALGTELGYPRSSSGQGKAGASRTSRPPITDQRRAAGIIGVVNGFGMALGKRHGIELLAPDGKRIYWLLPFYSAPLPPEGGWPPGEEPTDEYGVDENGHFLWILWPELAEAMERLGLVDGEGCGSIAQALEKLNLVKTSEAADPVEISEDAAAAISAGFREGALKKRWVNAYERDDKARAACVAHYGARCQACGFDFGQAYGPLGAGFIHAHHVVPLAQIRESYEVDPIRDLIPLCPNCHAMIHRGAASAREAMTLEDLRALIAEARRTTEPNR